jgi:hypothetical protein
MRWITSHYTYTEMTLGSDSVSGSLREGWLLIDTLNFPGVIKGNEI